MELSQLLYLGEALCGVGQSLVVDPLVSDDALFVDDDHCAAVCTSFRVPDAQSLGRFTFWMEVGEQGIGKDTQSVGPRPVRVMAVAAYAQDLGTFLLEPVVVLPEGGGLAGSTSGEV